MKDGLWQFNLARFGSIVKNLKKQLPSSCTFLSPLKTKDLETGATVYRVRAIINKNEYRFSVPDNMIFSAADIAKLRELLISKC